MMRVLAVCCLAALTAACSKTPQTPAAQAPTASAPAPAAQPATPAETPAPATPTATVATTQYVLPFTSQAEEGAPEDPRIVRWGEGPCGATPYARVSAIPLEDKSLLADYVVEFDQAERELRRWGKPYEADVIGLEGQWLRVRARDSEDKSHEFRIDVAGRIESIADKAQALADRSKMIDCPKLPTFAESDYEQCYDVTDAAGAQRRLAYEGVCA